MANILLVDDAMFMRTILKKILTDAGHSVVAEAENGIDAIKKYSEYNPDIVTMDITMPEMNGVDAVREIKKKYPNAKIIMCSAMGQQAMVIEAIQSGASDFIVKPFDGERVLSSINNVLSK